MKKRAARQRKSKWFWMLPVKCPHCGSAETYCATAKFRPIRYHRCRACRARFKSVETVYVPALVPA